MKIRILGLFVIFAFAGCTTPASGIKENAQYKNIKQGNIANNENSFSKIEIMFKENGKHVFSKEEKKLISKILIHSEQRIRRLEPTLPEKVIVNLIKTDKDYNNLGGVNGQASAPGVVDMEVSSTYPQGMNVAINKNLSAMVFHEFHHLARGWTMKGNKFDAGMDIAAINEGLAVAFSIKYSGGDSSWANYPQNIQDWAMELLNLPKYASYGKWVVKHPDGREKIAYRAGRYMIDEAVKNSGKSLLELTKLAPIEIIKLSGLMEKHVISHFKLAEFYQLNNKPVLAIEAYQKSAEISFKNKNYEDVKKYRNRSHLVNHPILLSKSKLQQLSGEYNSSDSKFTINDKEGSLYVKIKGWPTFELIPEYENKFYLWGEPETFEFIYNSEHKIEKLIFNDGDKIIDAIKNKQ